VLFLRKSGLGGDLRRGWPPWENKGGGQCGGGGGFAGGDRVGMSTGKSKKKSAKTTWTHNESK